MQCTALEDDRVDGEDTRAYSNVEAKGRPEKRISCSPGARVRSTAIPAFFDCSNTRGKHVVGEARKWSDQASMTAADEESLLSAPLLLRVAF